MSKQTAEWIRDKYVKWRGNRIKASVREFSEWLGVSNNKVVNWMYRGQTPNEAGLSTLAKKTGDATIFDVAGVPRDDKRLRSIIEFWGELTDETREKIFETFQRRPRSKTAPDHPGVEHTERGHKK